MEEIKDELTFNLEHSSDWNTWIHQLGLFLYTVLDKRQDILSIYLLMLMLLLQLNIFVQLSFLPESVYFSWLVLVVFPATYLQSIF